MNWIPEPMFWEHGDLCLWYGCHLPKSYRDSKYLERKTLAKGWSSLFLSTVNERKERVLLSGRDWYMDSTEVRCVKLKLSLYYYISSLYLWISWYLNTCKALVSFISFFVFFVDQAVCGMTLNAGKDTITQI